MYIKILILFLTLKTLKTSCTAGCLQCSKSDTCSLCDPFNSYYLENYKCEKASINCEQLLSKNSCSLCPPKHHYDANSSECQMVPPLSQTENCLRYSNNLSCKKCQEGFFLNNAKCVVPEKAIDNCRFYKNGEECEECEFGYVPAIDLKKCVFAFSGNNCLFYDFVECGECFSGYKKNEGKYVSDFFGEGEKDWSVMERVFLKSWGKVEVEVCSKVVVEHCREFSDFDKCFECDEGYFRDSNFRCQENPLPKFLNCFGYLNESACQECEAGFFLTTDAVCKENDVIQGCSYYSGTLFNETRCLRCEKDRYLFQNTCVQRKNVVDNCEENDLFSDQCEKCGFEKVPSSDGLKCFDKILNCKEYTASSQSFEMLTCQKCEDGYYYHETLKKCEKGTVANCKHYFQNSNKCSLCQSTHYLENELCLAHPLFENCDIYDPSQKSECSYCKKGFVIIKHTNGCVRVENIKQGCILYKNANECEKCETGYFLTNQNTCDLVPLSSNCEIYTSSGCQKCKEDYILENSACFLPISIFVDNCLHKSINGSHTFQTAKCDICSKGSFPYNLKGQFYCLENWRRINIKNANINNCLRYSYESSQMVCKECQANFWLKDDGTCIEKENCNLAYLPFKKYSSHNKIEKRNLCTTITTGCLLGALNSKNMNTIECAKCNSLTHIQKIASFEDPDFIPYNNFSITSSSPPALSPVSYYPRIECLLNNDSSLVDNSVVNNCELYGDIGAGKIGCLKCKHGFSGLLENFNDVGYVNSCVDMASCEDKEYFGLLRDIKLLSSCSVCKSPGEIPFIFVNGDAFFHKIKGLLAYNASFEKTTQGGLSNKCLQKTTSALKLTNLNLPSHCSLAVYNINSVKDASESNKTTNIDKTKIAAFCVSCEPAWRPLSGTDSTGQLINNYVGHCEEITNCDFSDWFNNCSKCKNGHVYEFVAGKGILYNICINYDKDFSCLAIDNSNPASPICKVCKKGFFLNLDSICESVTFSKCESFEPMLKMELDLYRTWNYMFYEIEGCNNCTNGYDLFLKPPNEDFNVCYLSDYVNNREVSYIPNCNDYYANLETIKCYKCNDGYTKDRYEVECVNQEKSDCLKMDKNTYKCIECGEQSVVVNGVCLSKNKTNCETYSTAEGNLEQICIKCKEGFFLKSNNCEKGKIENCALFTGDGSDCLTCMDNFIKGKTVEGKNYCILVNLDFDCGEFDSISVDQLTCSACNKDYYLTTDNSMFRKSSCLEINTILNCKEYDVGEKFNKSSFQCLDCDLNYYLQDNLCIKRKVVDSNCSEYSKTKDSCHTCKEKHFVTTSGTCRRNPSGISNCQKYSNNTTCLTCKTDTYLQNNTCQPVLTKIENCEEYESGSICKKCISNHILQNQKCEKSEALNCLTYTNSKNCETCPEKFGFKTEGGIKSCVFKNHVTNCKKSENEYPFLCLECHNQTLLDSKKDCVPPLEKIENCEEYEKEGVCLKCASVAILNENGTRCVLVKDFEYNVDKNCRVNYKLKNPVCRICEKGFYLFLGECLKCHVYNCAICDVEKEGKECIMCDLEHFMDESGKCQLVSDGLKVQLVNAEGFLGVWAILVVFLVFK